MALESEPQKGLEAMYARSGIATRRSVLPDFHLNGAPRTMYPQDLEAGFPGIERRMAVFREKALPLALEAIPELEEPPTHLIAVSCTGLSAPGLDLDLMKALGLPADTQRTCVHFMGCYAAIHALKQADTICRAYPEARVLVVAVELCSLHFQKPQTMDQRAANLLFADGAAAALITGQEPQQPHFRVEKFASRVVTQGEADMAWELGPEAFLMKLSAYIPDLLEGELEQPLAQMFGERSLKSSIEWAVHPGGRKILDRIGKVFQLGNDQLASSYQILKTFGNMSSPTVLYILERILRENPKEGLVPTMAFGPGLTIEAALLHRHA